MAFNLEDKIKWEELSPSLQAKFKELEDAINEQDQSHNQSMGGVRVTVNEVAPVGPVNNAELWWDETYKVLRAYGENNWEFTRAAWYGGDSSGIQPPPTGDEEIPEPEIPEYHPKTYTNNYMIHTQTGTSIQHEWNSEYTTEEQYGTNIRYIFGRTISPNKNKVTITVDVSALTTSGTVGYLLAVTGLGSEGMEYGDPHLWPIDKSRGNVNDFMDVENGDYFAGDVDCYGFECKKIVPGNQPNDDVYGTIYFPADFPYRVDVANWNTPGQDPTIPTRNYPAVQGTFKITITFTETY